MTTRVSDARVLEAFAIEADDRFYLAVQELVARGIEDSRSYSESPEITSLPNEQLYYAGGANALVKLLQYLEQTRVVAKKNQVSANHDRNDLAPFNAS